MSPSAWTDAAAYERYVGQWSRIIAPQFVDWLGASPGLAWLDIACGTGALTAAILELAQPASLNGVDPSPVYLGAAQANIKDARVRFRQGKAEALPYPGYSFDVVVSALVLNFIDAPRALVDQQRVVKAGGMIAAYIWDYAGQYEYARLFWDAALTVDSNVESYDPRRRFPLCGSVALDDVFRQSGLAEVQATAIDSTASFPSFDAYWQAIDARQGSMAEYLSSISEETRAQIRAGLSKRVRRDADGAVHLNLRAIAVKGRVC
jgi:SAM-dependent methyltransferase